jgi:hypothetical protein
MRLPNAKDAYIPRAKISHYLLDEEHQQGRSKAAFLRYYGYDEGTVGLLEQRLLAIANSEGVVVTRVGQYGTNYVVDGELPTPFGTAVYVRTVWFVERGHNRPRLATAYPIRRRTREELS